MDVYSFLKEVMQKKENEFNIEKYDNQFFSDKLGELSGLKEKLEEVSLLKDSEFNMIKKMAQEKGGFLKNEFRIFFYSLILNIKTKSPYSDSEEFTPSGRFADELKVDCERSILHNLFEDDILYDNNGTFLIKNLKEDLEKCANDFFDHNHNHFDYYQGYQEVCLYMMILHPDSINKKCELNLIFLQKLSEIYFSFFISKKDKIKFDHILPILSDIIEAIDANINNSLLEMTKAPPFYALSWIITWFAHKNRSIPVQFRIFDYLICSPPFTIFYLVAIVNII